MPPVVPRFPRFVVPEAADVPYSLGRPTAVDRVCYRGGGAAEGAAADRDAGRLSDAGEPQLLALQGRGETPGGRPARRRPGAVLDARLLRRRRHPLPLLP